MKTLREHLLERQVNKRHAPNHCQRRFGNVWIVSTCVLSEHVEAAYGQKCFLTFLQLTDGTIRAFLHTTHYDAEGVFTEKMDISWLLDSFSEEEFTEELANIGFDSGLFAAVEKWDNLINALPELFQTEKSLKQ